MADFGPAVGGFAQGFGKSFNATTMLNMQYRKRQNALAAKKLDLEIMGSMFEAFKEKDPAMRTMRLNTLAKVTGAKPDKTMMNLLQKMDADTATNLSEIMRTTAGDLPPGFVKGMVKSVITGKMDLPTAMTRMQKVGDQGLVKKLMKQHKGNKTKVAEALHGMGRTELAQGIEKSIKQQVETNKQRSAAVLAARKQKEVERHNLIAEKVARDRLTFEQGNKAEKQITLVHPDGKRPLMLKATDSAAIEKARKDGYVEGKVQLDSLGGLTKGGKSKLVVQRRASMGRAAAITSAIRKANSLGPGVAGLASKLGRGFGGLIGQVDAETGKAVTEYLTGVDPNKLQQFTVRAQNIMAESIPLMTGEQSGRISEPERELTKVVSAIDTATASFPQLVGGMTAMSKLAIVQAERLAYQAGDKPRFEFGGEIGSKDFESSFNKHYGALKKLTNLPDEDLDDLMGMLVDNQQFHTVLGGLDSGG